MISLVTPPTSLVSATCLCTSIILWIARFWLSDNLGLLSISSGVVVLNENLLIKVGSLSIKPVSLL